MFISFGDKPRQARGVGSFEKSENVRFSAKLILLVWETSRKRIIPMTDGQATLIADQLRIIATALLQIQRELETLNQTVKFRA